MEKWICANCESLNHGITLCKVCDYENPDFPLVKIRDFSVSKSVFFEDEMIDITWDIDNYSMLQLIINKDVHDVTSLSSFKYYPDLKLKGKKKIKIVCVVYDMLGDKLPELKEKIMIFPRIFIENLKLPEQPVFNNYLTFSGDCFESDIVTFSKEKTTPSYELESISSPENFVFSSIDSAEVVNIIKNYIYD